MYLEEKRELSTTIKISVQCDFCEKNLEVSTLAAHRNHKRNGGKYRCTKCGAKSAATIRPQNTKEYWSREDVKENHSKTMKNSEKYYESLKHIKNKGEFNSMYGKTHSEEAIQKMIKYRTGRKQSKETVEKRISTMREKRLQKILSGEKFEKNLNTVVRQFVNSEFKWSRKVFERDGFKCTKCQSSEKIDAHHIKPFSIIVKELLKNTDFKTDKEKFIFLHTQPELTDETLSNGTTLCRKCHREIHKNWGSHYAT